MKFSLIKDNYFPFQAGKSYEQVGSGLDWVQLKCRGQVYSVDNAYIDQDPIDSLYELEEESFEICLEMELYDLLI